MYQKQIENMRNDMESLEPFKTPNWQERTSFELGIIKGLRIATTLLPKDSNKETK